jgi:hypothetical protein
MKVARYVLMLGTLAAVVTAAACSDSGAFEPGPARFSGTPGDSSGGGSGSGQGGGGSSGGGQTPPDTALTPPVGWPRSIQGLVQGVTITPGTQDSLRAVPLANATLTLYQLGQSGPQQFATTTTDAQGAFGFANLPQAEYSAKVTPPAGSPYKEVTLVITPQSLLYTVVINLQHQ